MYFVLHADNPTAFKSNYQEEPKISKIANFTREMLWNTEYMVLWNLQILKVLTITRRQAYGIWTEIVLNVVGLIEW